MQEFFFPIKETLSAGLRRDSYNSRNNHALVRCVNMRPTPYGLSSTVRPSVLSGVAMTWPFPQILCGQHNTFLCEQTAIYTINTVNGARTQVVTYDSLSTSSTKTITSGGIWELVEFGPDAWFLSNGSCVVAYTPLTDKAVVCYKVWPNAMIGHHNSLVMAGINRVSPHPVGTSLSGTLVSGTKVFIDEHVTGLSYSNYNHYVFIGPRNGGDIDLPYTLDLAILGALSSTNITKLTGLVEDMAREGKIFAVPMNTVGVIESVQPLGEGVAVYGTKGIAIIPTIENIAAPIHVSDMRVAKRGMCAGSPQRNIVLTDAGVLFSVGADMSVREEGYSEYLTSVAAETVVMSYNPREEEYWISTGTKCFVLTRKGLCESSVKTGGFYLNNGAPIGAISGTATGIDIETDVFDLGNRGIKMVESVEVGATNITGMDITISYKTEGETFKTRTVPCNKNNIGVPHVCGTDFRVRVEGDTSGNARIDYLNVRWKQTDKRFLRGPYATGA